MINRTAFNVNFQNDICKIEGADNNFRTLNLIIYFLVLSPFTLIFLLPLPIIVCAFLLLLFLVVSFYTTHRFEVVIQPETIHLKKQVLGIPYYSWQIHFTKVIKLDEETLILNPESVNCVKIIAFLSWEDPSSVNIIREGNKRKEADVGDEDTYEKIFQVIEQAFVKFKVLN